MARRHVARRRRPRRPARRVAGRPAPSARQVPLAGPRGADGHGRLLHLGMSGQLLVQPPRRPGREAPATPGSGSPTDRPELRFVDQRTFGGRRARRARRRRHPGADRPHRPRPARGRCDQAAVVAPGEGQAAAGSSACLLDQSLASRHRQHLRRRGAVAGRDPRRAARQPAHQAGPPPAAGHAARRHGGGPRPGRDELRRALRQRQRLVGLLRPVPRRLRAGGPAVPPLRDADPARARS